MDGPHITLVTSICLGATALVCLSRMYILRLSSVYPATTCFFASQLFFSLIPNVMVAGSLSYQPLFAILLVVEWLVYGFMTREIYGLIFHDYPGIAIIGRWSAYLGVLATVSVLAISILGSRKLSVGSSAMILNMELAAHSLTFGFAILLLLLLVAIGFYPLRLRRNIVVNAVVFGAVLIGEASGLIVDRFTGRSYTMLVNLCLSALEILLLALWTTLLTRERATAIRLRPAMSPAYEDKLHAQLVFLNDMILRAASK